MTIADALEKIDKVREDNEGELATNLASDVVRGLVEHWKIAADCWGGEGLDGKKFKAAIVGDLNDVIHNLKHLLSEIQPIVAKVDDGHVHVRIKK